MGQCLTSAQRQAQKLILGPGPTAKICPLSGYNPELFLASLLDITPRAGFST